MEKIDRLGWAAGISLYSYGLRIGIRVTDPAVLPLVEERLPPGWEPCCSPFPDFLFSLKLGRALNARLRQYHLLYSGAKRVARTMSQDEVLDTLEGELQLCVAEWARNRVFIHAGVVGWGGKAILIPGRSFAGKSRLTAALLGAGADYFSDEYAVLDAQGLVHPYPRRLAIRQPNSSIPQRRRPEEFDSAIGCEPLPVGMVVMTRYQEGARWSPRPLSLGKAILELSNNAVPVQREPDTVLTTLQKALSHAKCLTGVRGEAEEMAAKLLEELNTRRPALAAA
jgi:hypothetical protein